MGSSGTGSFGDLKAPSNKELCLREIREVLLEEVSLSQYYNNQRKVPDKDYPVEVGSSTINGRLVVISSENFEIVGYIPSRFSYLLGCMKKGHKYTGNVIFSTESPIPRIMVNLDAQ
jgi:hypothetical protein